MQKDATEPPALVSVLHYWPCLLKLPPALLSAAIVTRSCPLCSTAVAFCHVHVILWEWRERRSWREEGGLERRESEYEWLHSAIPGWACDVRCGPAVLNHLSCFVPHMLWTSCHAGCDLGVERYVILYTKLQRLHLVHSRKIKIRSSTGGRTGWVGLTEQC